MFWHILARFPARLELDIISGGGGTLLFIEAMRGARGVVRMTHTTRSHRETLRLLGGRPIFDFCILSYVLCPCWFLALYAGLRGR